MWSFAPRSDRQARGRPSMSKHTRLHLLAIALAGAAGVTSAPARAGDPSPREIMDQVIATRKLDGSEATIRMISVGETGERPERQIAMATKLYDGGKTEKRIYRFLSPADVQGTGVLVFDHQDRSDDVWIYLPALRRTRRVVSAQRSQAFMGSEFS